MAKKFTISIKDLPKKPIFSRLRLCWTLHSRIRRFLHKRNICSKICKSYLQKKFLKRVFFSKKVFKKQLPHQSLPKKDLTTLDYFKLYFDFFYILSLLNFTLFNTKAMDFYTKSTHKNNCAFMRYFTKNAFEG